MMCQLLHTMNRGYVHTGVYFAASACVCAVCFLLYACILPKLAFVQYHRKKSRASLQPYSMEPVAARPSVELHAGRTSPHCKTNAAAELQLQEQEVSCTLCLVCKSRIIAFKPVNQSRTACATVPVTMTYLQSFLQLTSLPHAHVANLSKKHVMVLQHMHKLLLATAQCTQS